MLHILGLGQDGTACSWKIGGMASDEESLMDALSQSHEFEILSFLCNLPKRAITCLVLTPILQSRAFSLRDFLLDCFVSDNVSAPPFHVAEIPLFLDLSGSIRDLLIVLSEVEVSVVCRGIH
jgi:hypothetical protein